MIDKAKLNTIIEQYKRDFSGEWWNKENYKWAAVKHFQDNWDINSLDFADMLSRSLQGAKNLLTSRNYFAEGMIIGMAERYPDDIRNMFKELFDEQTNVADRILNFKDKSEALAKALVGSDKNSYQDVRAISVYLWLRYPDKHYIYKYSELRAIAKTLDYNFSFTKSSATDNIRHCTNLYDLINAAIRQDASLLQMEKELTMNGDFYWNPESRIMASDLGFYISRGFDGTKGEGNWLPMNYDPGLTTALTYTKQDFLKDVFMSNQEYDRLARLLARKKNLILQGAPGVGKTFTAKRLAYSMIGTKNDDQIEMVQFHQSYSYEDFVMGYRPNAEGGFELRKGVFYEFCERAHDDPDNKYFFIIDEINRGNLSKIFGELLMLIEKDYRGVNHAISLAYCNNNNNKSDKNDDAFDGGRRFFMPENVYIIGMMNTADRSLALMDYALRRRFSFYTIEPKFDSDGFKKLQKDMRNKHFDKLVDAIKRLNAEIVDDSTLGSGFQIGHSYLCLNKDKCTDAELENIVDFEIAPMLQEYWFDDDEKAQTEIRNLKKIFQHAE